MFPLPWCLTWLAVLLTLSVAIVALNLITIIVFVKNCNLRKRSRYLLINLAGVDTLAGAVSVLTQFIGLGVSCELWKHIKSFNYVIICSLYILFFVCSLLNITVISVERLHATFCPFRHRMIKKGAYGLLIAGIWLASVLITAGLEVIRDLTKGHQNLHYLWCSFNSTCLLVICVSYGSIVIKVRCGAQPQHHGAASRERKLTMTLLIVTVVSLLLWLPYVVSAFLFHTTDAFSSLGILAVNQINFAMIVLFYANSLANPIVYAYRIPEFRRALVALFRKRPQQLNQAAVIPLRDM